MSGRVLVAGVGNIFQGDDGFGSIAARRLSTGPWPDGVQVIDYGIRSVHLAYDLLDGYDVLVLLDAAPRGGTPGDLVVLEVGPEDLSAAPANPGGPDPHRMDPGSVLAELSGLGGRLPRTFVVACEPADVSERMGLSPAVAAAVDRTTGVVTELLVDLLDAADPLQLRRVNAGKPDRRVDHPGQHTKERSA